MSKRVKVNAAELLVKLGYDKELSLRLIDFPYVVALALSSDLDSDPMAPAETRYSFTVWRTNGTAESYELTPSARRVDIAKRALPVESYVTFSGRRTVDFFYDRGGKSTKFVADERLGFPVAQGWPVPSFLTQSFNPILN